MLNRLLIVLLGFIVLFPKLTLVTISGSNVGIRFDDLAVLIIAVCLALTMIRRRGLVKASLSGPVTRYWLLFIVWGIASTLIGLLLLDAVESPLLGMLYLGRYVEFFVVYLAASLVVWDRTILKTLYLVFFFSAVAVVAYGFLQLGDLVPYFTTLLSLVNPEEVTYATSGVIMSTFAGHYDFGIYLVLVLGFLLFFMTGTFRRSDSYRSLEEKLGQRQSLVLFICYLLMVLLISFAIYLTNSRSSFIAVVVVLIVWGYSNSRRLSIAASLTGAMLASLYLRGKLSNKLGRFKIGTKALTFDLSSIERLRKWITLFSEFGVISLISGFGLSSQGEALDGYYMRLLGEMGLIGIGLFALMLWSLMAAINRVRKVGPSDLFWTGLAEGMRLGTLALLVQAMFIDTFVATKIMYVFWLLAGVVVSKDREPGTSRPDNNMRPIS